jgi:DNA-3-methyladenine glycosylase I
VEISQVVNRCPWANNALNIPYHDEEWGVPVHEDRRLFEFLILEGAQAGLSWDTLLAKRPHYRQVFDAFDPAVVATYTHAKIAQLLADPGIIRNRLKVNAAVTNAQAFLRVQQTYGSFDAYCWQFVQGKPEQHQYHTMQDLPTATPAAMAMSKDLKRKGFTFVGPTICYAYMQAVGMVNDHVVGCFRHAECQHKQ